MALTDILTVPFLISLGVTLLLVGLVGYFFTQRLQEQNHKMASMLGLVTTMAEEMNFIRGRLQMISYQGGAQQNSQPESVLEKQFSYEQNLIPVSDGENDDDSSTENGDSDGEEESEEESESESEQESESEEEQSDLVEHEFEELEPAAVKVINFGELLNAKSDAEELDNNSEELSELDDEIEDDDASSESGSDSSDKNADKKSSLSQSSKPDFEFIKSIDISNLEESESSEKNSNVDYKKMSLNKLKDIAVAKGLIQENSKATKNAILKLLGSE